MARRFQWGQSLDLDRSVIAAMPMTISAWIKRNDSNNAMLAGLFGSGAASIDARYLSIEGGFLRSVVGRDAWNYSLASVLSPTVPVGEWVHAVAVHRADNTHAAFLNGGNSSGFTNAFGSPVGLDRTLISKYLQTGGGTTFSIDVEIAEVAFWGQELTQNEIMQLALGMSPLEIRPRALAAYYPIAGIGSAELSPIGNQPMIVTGATAAPRPPRIIPYSQPNRLYRWVQGAGSGPITLAIANALHAHAADNIALTQAHALTVNGAAHAHSADNLALTQAHSLAVAGATHAHAADNLTLTQVHSLLVDSATHGHTAESLILTVQGELGIASALHAHTVGNLDLTQVHALVIGSAAHAHSADNLSLSESVELSIANASHAQVADGLTLVSEQALAIADALHAHTAGAVTLDQIHQLIISNALHAHLATQCNVYDESIIPISSNVILVLGAERNVLVLGDERHILVH